MSSQALSLSFGMETRWTITSGPMKGTSRVMSAAQFTIGRSTDCELAIPADPKCSRRHVSIVCNPHGVDMVCLNESNPVLVNGHEVVRARLNNGDTLTLGDTEIKFTLQPASLAAVPLPPADAVFGGQPAAQRPRGRAQKVGNKSNMKRYLMYGGLVLILYFIFSETKPKESMKIRSDADAEIEIETATKLRDAGEKQNIATNDGSVNSRQAQEYYVRSFRDYRDGQYERALLGFQACLALNPEHPLCTRYLRLSQRKFNELVQYQILMGRKYRDQNQYRACRAAFRNVMVMVKDAASLTYKEAKANYEACNAFAEGKF